MKRALTALLFLGAIALLDAAGGREPTKSQVMRKTLQGLMEDSELLDQEQDLNKTRTKIDFRPYLNAAKQKLDLVLNPIEWIKVPLDKPADKAKAKTLLDQIQKHLEIMSACDQEFFFEKDFIEAINIAPQEKLMVEVINADLWQKGRSFFNYSKNMQERWLGGELDTDDHIRNKYKNRQKYDDQQGKERISYSHIIPYIADIFFFTYYFYPYQELPGYFSFDQEVRAQSDKQQFGVSDQTLKNIAYNYKQGEFSYYLSLGQNQVTFNHRTFTLEEKDETIKRILLLYIEPQEVLNMERLRRGIEQPYLEVSFVTDNNIFILSSLVTADGVPDKLCYSFTFNFKKIFGGLLYEFFNTYRSSVNVFDQHKATYLSKFYVDYYAPFYALLNKFIETGNRLTPDEKKACTNIKKYELPKSNNQKVKYLKDNVIYSQNVTWEEKPLYIIELLREDANAGAILHALKKDFERFRAWPKESAIAPHKKALQK